MKKILSIVALTAMVAVSASANTKVGIYAGYGAGSFDVENTNYSHSMHLAEGGLFVDNTLGHLYTGLQIGYGKYKYDEANPHMVTLRGKAGVHFNTKLPVNIYGLLTGGYGSDSNSDFTTFGYGGGIGVDFTKHWGIEVNYVHSNDYAVYTAYINTDEGNSYQSYHSKVNRGEVFLKYSF